MDSVENVNSIEANVLQFTGNSRTLNSSPRAKSKPPLGPAHLQEITVDVVCKSWWRGQYDIELLDWLADNQDPNLVGKSLKLMNASMRSTPPGTLPDDDATLAKAAGYFSVKTFAKVKARLLDDLWFKRADGRWQCAVLTEGIMARKNKTIGKLRKSNDES